MEYRVIKYFTDLQDNEYPYHTGDIYPRDGLIVSDERIKELSSDKNLQRTPLIVLVTSSVDESEKSEESAGEHPTSEATPKKRTRKRKKEQ